MRYSNDCRRLGQLLVSYRDVVKKCSSKSADPWQSYKDLVFDLHSYDPDIKEKIIELLKYQYEFDGIPVIQEWTIPQFPVTPGMFILKGVKKGQNYRLILEQLQRAWKQSNYQASEKQLLDEVLPNLLTNPSSIINDTSIPIPSAFSLSKKRKKSR